MAGGRRRPEICSGGLGAEGLCRNLGSPRAVFKKRAARRLVMAPAHKVAAADPHYTRHPIFALHIAWVENALGSPCPGRRCCPPTGWGPCRAWPAALGSQPSGAYERRTAGGTSTNRTTHHVWRPDRSSTLAKSATNCLQCRRGAGPGTGGPGEPGRLCPESRAHPRQFGKSRKQNSSRIHAFFHACHAPGWPAHPAMPGVGAADDQPTVMVSRGPPEPPCGWLS